MIAPGDKQHEWKTSPVQWNIEVQFYMAFTRLADLPRPLRVRCVCDLVRAYSAYA